MPGIFFLANEVGDFLPHSAHAHPSPADRSFMSAACDLRGLGYHRTDTILLGLIRHPADLTR